MQRWTAEVMLGLCSGIVRTCLFIDMASTAPGFWGKGAGMLSCMFSTCTLCLLVCMYGMGPGGHPAGLDALHRDMIEEASLLTLERGAVGLVNAVWFFKPASLCAVVQLVECSAAAWAKLM